MSFNIPKNCEPNQFWKSCEKAERKNANLYKEFEISLPRELSQEQNRKLALSFVSEFVPNQPATLAIHAGKNEENPHIHLMFSMRANDNVERENSDMFFKRANKKEPARGGAAKVDNWRGKDFMMSMRKQVEAMINQALADADISQRVSCKSLKNQNIDRIPQPKIGSAAREISARGEESWKLEKFEDVMKLNAKSIVIANRKDLLKDNKSLQRQVVADLKYIQSLKFEFATLKKPAEPRLFQKVARFIKRKKLSNEFKPALEKAQSKISDIEFQIENSFFLKSMFLQTFNLSFSKHEFKKVADDYNIVNAEHEQLMQNHNSKLLENHDSKIELFEEKSARLKNEIKSQEQELTSTFDMSLSELKAECAPFLQEKNLADDARLKQQIAASREREQQQKIESANFFAEYEAANKSNDFDMC